MLIKKKIWKYKSLREKLFAICTELKEWCENKLDICCFFAPSSQDLVLLSPCSFFFLCPF